MRFIELLLTMLIVQQHLKQSCTNLSKTREALQRVAGEGVKKSSYLERAINEPASVEQI